MAGYVAKISKSSGKVIVPPTPEEILDDNFNYPDYIKHILNLEADYDLLEEFFDRDEEDVTPVNPHITEAYEEFENAIVILQKQYEDEIKTGTLSLDYNKAMKKIARAYFDKLKAITSFQLQKEAEFKAITAKRNELVTALNKVVEIKRNIEDGAESRLTAFVNREIPLGKLYIYDLIHLQNNEIYLKNKKKLDEYRRIIVGRLLNDDGVQYKPIKDLNFARKK